jgi:hypothetical protein
MGNVPSSFVTLSHALSGVCPLVSPVIRWNWCWLSRLRRPVWTRLSQPAGPGRELQLYGIKSSHCLALGVCSAVFTGYRGRCHTGLAPMQPSTSNQAASDHMSPRLIHRSIAVVNRHAIFCSSILRCSPKLNNTKPDVLTIQVFGW